MFGSVLCVHYFAEDERAGSFTLTLKAPRKTASGKFRLL